MKFIIVLAYYNRPNMVRNALKSVKDQTYKNWELAFIDDASPKPGRPVVEQMFNEEELNKTTLFLAEYDEKDPKTTEFSKHGLLINEAIKNSWADIVVILCDDDALFPDYLEKLAEYYESHPTVSVSYCHLSIFNPLEEKLNFKDKKAFSCRQNDTRNLSHGNSVFDSSQVTYRRSVAAKCKYPPMLANLDAWIFSCFSNKKYVFYFNGILGVLKGSFPGQMGKCKQKAAIYATVDLDPNKLR